jgi:hypothetical protein
MDILPSWQMTITKLSHLIVSTYHCWALMTFRRSRCATKTMFSRSRKVDMGKDFLLKRFCWILVQPNKWCWDNEHLWVLAWLMMTLKHVHIRFWHPWVHHKRLVGLPRLTFLCSWTPTTHKTNHPNRFE